MFTTYCGKFLWLKTAAYVSAPREVYNLNTVLTSFGSVGLWLSNAQSKSRGNIAQYYFLLKEKF
jgi:hypothetical protein